MRGLTHVAYWRSASLLGVNLLIAAHLLHGWWVGESLGRVVFADAATTFVHGVVTPAVLLFSAAILATLVFGRFFCGWLCHMAALQETCAWLLRRIGVRPRPLKARLLGYLPLLLALYLFVWPSFKRAALLPLLSMAWPTALTWLEPVSAFPGWSLQWTSQELWAGLPHWTLALPFLLLSGFATVYFLGARGLCRYACPYGGVFMPAARLAVYTIVVDPDRCDGCARCTAACGAGVDVLRELRLTGAVNDRHCVRSLDCIAACPQGALRIGPARLAGPVAAAGSRRTLPELGLGEEWLVAVIALAVIVITRGLYGTIPLLLAVTLGALAGAVALLVLRLVRRRDLRFRGRALRSGGRLTGSGRAFAVLAALFLLLLLHSAVARACLWQAQRLDAAVTVPLAQVLEPRPGAVSALQRERAQTALRWYRRAAPLHEGGIALGRWPELPLRMAWLHLVRAEYVEAERELQAALKRGDRDPALLQALAVVDRLRPPRGVSLRGGR